MPVVTSSTASSVSGNSFDHRPVLTADWVKVSLAATQVDNTNDQVLCYLFPDRAYLWGGADGLRVKATDMDTGTPALTMNFGIGDSDGTIDTTLINASTIGQAGGVDEIDTGKDPWIDVGGKYLIMDVGTAAGTEAAGSLEFGILFSTGVRLSSGS